MKDQSLRMTPASLAAAAKGDFANAIVAATPGGIERSEKAGQAALVASTDMPKSLSPDRAAFEKLGFTFGTDVDELFVKATLPPGWTRAATDHSMHSDILDEKGRKRVSVFYKAAFYRCFGPERLGLTQSALTAAMLPKEEGYSHRVWKTAREALDQQKTPEPQG